MSQSVDTEPDDDIDFATLDALRGDDEDYDGPLDHPCPLCGPERSTEYNRNRATLRTWRLSSTVISFFCARCEVKGSVAFDVATTFQATPRLKMPTIPPKRPRATSGNLYYVERLWEKATFILPAGVVGVFQMARHPARRPTEGRVPLSSGVSVVGQEDAVSAGALQRCADR